MQEKFKLAKNDNKKELASMVAEVKNLKMSQVELEIIANYYTKNEISLKQKIKRLSGKNSIERLRNENLETENQINDLDKNILNLFQELNSMLDSYENNRKPKGKKNKKRSSLVTRKSILSVCP